MKTRPKGFLSEEHINHDSEIFDYIGELHDYLWRFVRAENPGANGGLSDFIDSAVEQSEERAKLIETPKTIIIFPNGNTGVFDEKGNQIPRLQQSWISIYYEWLESKGIDPEEVDNIEMIVNGEEKYAKPFRVDGGWNTRFVDF